MAEPPNHPERERLYMDGISHYDDLGLICAAAGWKETTPEYRAIQLELQRRAKRREQRVAWAAIGISVLSLVVSITNAFLSRA